MTWSFFHMFVFSLCHVFPFKPKIYFDCFWRCSFGSWKKKQHNMLSFFFGLICAAPEDTSRAKCRIWTHQEWDIFGFTASIWPFPPWAPFWAYFGIHTYIGHSFFLNTKSAFWFFNLKEEDEKKTNRRWCSINFLLLVFDKPCFFLINSFHSMNNFHTLDDSVTPI